jgi:hypothetical protein
MRIALSALVLPAMLLGAGAACGPQASDPPDAAPPPDAGDPDGIVADAWVFADVLPPPVQMWVHTNQLLYVMDDATLSLTLIGAFNTPMDDWITDVAVTPDGTLYGISETKLYTIDQATGQATYIADVPGVSNVGLTFLPDGTLLATDQSGGGRRIEPANGMVTEIGAFGGGYATAGDLVAVADGTMYAISDEGPVGDEFTSNVLLTVDTDTGIALPVGQIGYGGVFGCAYANGHVYAFTRDGYVIEIDRFTGSGTLRKTYPVAFWGAGVTPLVVVE